MLSAVKSLIVSLDQTLLILHVLTKEIEYNILHVRINLKTLKTHLID